MQRSHKSWATAVGRLFGHYGAGHMRVSGAEFLTSHRVSRHHQLVIGFRAGVVSGPFRFSAVSITSIALSPPQRDFLRSTGTGGSEPRWRADGKELFYLTGGPDTSMMAVDIIRAGETLELGTPRELFRVSLVTDPNGPQYAVKSDGQRFLVVQPVGGPVGGNDPLPLTVVQNWTDRLNVEFRFD